LFLSPKSCQTNELPPHAPERISPPPVPAPAPAQAHHAPHPPRGTAEPARCSTRIPKPPREWWKVTPAPAAPANENDAGPALDNDMDEIQFAGAASMSDPHNYKQALKSDDSERWKEATLAEYNTLIQNGTWEIVDLPPGEKAIGSSWVFRIKTHSDGSIERYKARIVAQGCSQRPGRDYQEVHAPMPRPAMIRMMFAIAAAEDLELRSVDVSAAFTNGDLEEYIYMRQPEGFHEGSPNKVCRLRKLLYGLKQSARQWNIKLHTALTHMGFKRVEADRCLSTFTLMVLFIFSSPFTSMISPSLARTLLRLTGRLSS
jgi:hypothetical protein